ncbi:MAG: DHA2 family efflux MFS transporter permease subunit, partial [Rhodospirillales bacterium]|nr:DHA2 family efflux MFS transporter permease subunit [Rhodospirillales bacterium]
MTVINVAIPEIMGSFGIGQDKAQWLSAAFLAAMTSSMVLVDWMLRTFGPRAVYIGSLTLFSLGSILGGLAPEPNTLIIARALQGAGAGAIQPLAMLAIFRIYPPGERGRAMGIFGLGVMVAPALGPWVGGLTVDAFSWRLVFFIPLPFCAIAALLALFYLSPRDPKALRTSFDWVGFFFLITFTTSLLLGLSNGTREGWQSDIILSYLGVAVISFLAFVYWESNISNPILNMQLFLHPRFAAAAIVSFVFGLGFFGSFYLVPLFVQIIQGYTPTWSGLVLMPGSMLLLFMFPFMGRLTDMYEPNRLILIGLPLFGISSVLMAEASVDTPFWQFAWWLVISRMGIGLVFTPLTTASLRVLPPELLAQ